MMELKGTCIMLYRFFHPDDRETQFVWNDAVPMVLHKIRGATTQRLPLRHENINAEDFFFCLIKGKFVHIEDRYSGFAYVGENRYEIARPYDCKWAVHKILGITEKNPLIVSDRRENRYVWLYSDEEMQVPDDFLETLSLQKNPKGRSGEFSRMVRKSESGYSSSRNTLEEAFRQNKKEAMNGLSAFEDQTKKEIEAEKVNLGEPFARFESEWEKSKKDFEKNRSQRIREKRKLEQELGESTEKDTGSESAEKNESSGSKK